MTRERARKSVVRYNESALRELSYLHCAAVRRGLRGCEIGSEATFKPSEIHLRGDSNIVYEQLRAQSF